MIFWFSSPFPLIGWEVFYRLILCLNFPPQSPITGLGDFSPVTWFFETHQLPYKTRMFSFSPVFFLSLLHNVGRYFTEFLSINRWLPRPMELAFKRKGNCNVMVTRPTNHMTSARDHSNDPDTWPTNFIPTLRHHWFQFPRHHLSRHQVIIDCNIRVTIPMTWLCPNFFHHRSTRLQPIVDLK